MEDFLERLKNKCYHFGDIQNFLMRGDPNCKDDSSIFRLKGIWSRRVEKDNVQRSIYKNVCERCLWHEHCDLISFIHRSYKNIVVNDFGNDNIEVIFCKTPLYCIDESVNANIDNKRSMIEIDGVLFPRDENMSNTKFLENMSNSMRQSIDKFWGYALSNQWDYFITLTCDPKKVDRYSRDAVKAAWKSCRQRMQRFDPDVKILIVDEKHKDGAFHFHGLVAMRRPFEMRFFKINGIQQYSGTGAPLFEFPFWDKGLASCAVIYSDNDKTFNGEELAAPVNENGKARTTAQRRVVAYLNKYIGKEFGESSYGKKRFFHTTNLDFKVKRLEHLSEKNLLEEYGIDLKRISLSGNNDFEVSLTDDSKLYLYKQDNKRIYFRSMSEIAPIGDCEMCWYIKLDGSKVQIPLETAEAAAENGYAEKICENAQYKVFKELLKNDGER